MNKKLADGILEVMNKHLNDYDYSEDQFDGRFACVMKEALPKVAEELAGRIGINKEQLKLIPEFSMILVALENLFNNKVAREKFDAVVEAIAEANPIKIKGEK